MLDLKQIVTKKPEKFHLKTGLAAQLIHNYLPIIQISAVGYL